MIYLSEMPKGKISITKSCLKYCFKADNCYDFERRLRLLFLMKGWKV